MSRCAAATGSGCNWSARTAYRQLEAFTEGAADFSALWLTKGRYFPSLGIPYDPYTPDFEWGGTDTTQGDSYIDDYELSETCTGNQDCISLNCQAYNHPHIGDPVNPNDDQFKVCHCVTDQGCHPGGKCDTNVGICRKAACPNDQFCRNYFGMDDNVLCHARGFCFFHAYFNNRMMVNAWNRLRLHIGWERGVRYVFKAMAGVDEGTTLQEGVNSHYEKLKAQAAHEKLEVARSFASLKPGFDDWPDDQTNNWWVAPHLNSDGPYENTLGVPWDSGALTQFNYPGDTDYFVFRARPGETYRIWTSYASATVDACISLYAWAGGHTLVARDNVRCFDGQPGGSDLTWTAPWNAGGWYQVRFSNESGGTGSYQLKLQMQGDDHPDWSQQNFRWRDAEPIPHVQLVEAELPYGDSDYFKLYVPPDPAITSMDVYLISFAGDAEVWLDWGGEEDSPSWPQERSYSPTAGTLHYVLPANEKGWYYIDIENWGGTDFEGVLFFALNCGASTCTDEHDFGSRMDPYLIKIPWGNTISQRLDGAEDEDWYAIDLEEAEHASFNAYGKNLDCNLELRLYADENQPYYNCDGSCTVPSASATTQYVMRQVGFGADAHGSNLHLVAEKRGRYYLRVSSADGSDCTRYVLSVERDDLGGQTSPLWDYQTPDF